MAAKTPMDVPSFCTTQLALLEAELQSELSETSSLISNTSPTALQRAGLAITNLSLVSQRTGLGGKTVVELGVDSAFSKGLWSLFCAFPGLVGWLGVIMVEKEHVGKGEGKG